METPFVLLRLVAKAIANAIGGGVAGEILIEILPAVANDVWTLWSKNRSRDEMRTDLEEIVQIEPNKWYQLVTTQAKEVAADKNGETEQMIASYLTQLPAAIQRTMRRPSDPSGTTVPSEFVPQSAHDLLRILPSRLPQYKSGDHPLNGVDWELEHLLGIGGFGEVWKARNPMIPNLEPVALKFCLAPSAASALRNEALLLGHVMQQGHHSGIVQLRHAYLSAEIPCLEYEYVAGGDLSGLIYEWHRSGEGVQPQAVAKIILQLAQTLAHAHRNDPPIIHRDLKPANILVVQDDRDNITYKIADFGIGSAAAQQTIHSTIATTSATRFQISALQGAYTPLYASPQQMRGEPADPRDDVYALGVIWYQMLTGDLSSSCPSGQRWGTRLQEQGVGEVLIDLLSDCFEERADDRPADADELAEALATLLSGDTVISTSAAPTQQATSSAMSMPAVITHRPIEFDWVEIPEGEFWMGSNKPTKQEIDEFDAAQRMLRFSEEHKVQTKKPVTERPKPKSRYVGHIRNTESWVPFRCATRGHADLNSNGDEGAYIGFRVAVSRL